MTKKVAVLKGQLTKARKEVAEVDKVKSNLSGLQSDLVRARTHTHTHTHMHTHTHTPRKSVA